MTKWLSVGAINKTSNTLHVMVNFNGYGWLLGLVLYKIHVLYILHIHNVIYMIYTLSPHS